MASGAQRLPTDSIVVAQGGSTGGSIGKHAKSAVGTAKDGPRPARPAKKSSVGNVAKRSPAGSASRCGGLAGVWTANGWWNGLYGRGDVVLNADGSARHVSGIVGKWSCKGDHFVMDWTDWAHGEGTVSADGNTIAYDGGGTMTRGR
jgi:hypothetical protein